MLNIGGKRVNLRPDWESIRDDVMYQCLKSKFRDPYLRDLLLNTGDEFIEEGNSHGDRYWGTVNGEGRNVLGYLLMRVREELKNCNENI